MGRSFEDAKKYMSPETWWEIVEELEPTVRQQYEQAPDVFWFVQSREDDADTWLIEVPAKAQDKYVFHCVWEARYYALLLSADPDNVYGKAIETRVMKFTKTK